MPKLTTPGPPPRVKTEMATLAEFKGVDITSNDMQVAPYRSPEAPNMMPDADGFPTKRPGYEMQARYGGAIHGGAARGGAVHGAYLYQYEGVEKRLIHAGDTLYADGEPVYTGMADAHSTAVQLGGRLWILDGQTYLTYNGTEAGPVSEIATVPMITIAKGPNGSTGATSYRPVNLLTGKRTDSYLGTPADKAYTLSFNGLAGTAVTAQVLNAAGEWQPKAEGVDFTVNRAAGVVTFTAAPGASPVTGEDNVRITYETEASNAEKINACRVSILYGVNGALDRVFVSGSPAEPNVDYWSEFNDPAYMGDTFYGMLGQEASPIVGYSVLNNLLAAHKAGEENGRNAFVRTGEVDDEGFAVFRIVNVIQGEGAVSRRSFASLNGEPVFLTARGVYALTPSDITGERYSQSRSYYLNGGLLREPGQAGGAAAVWGRFYVLALGSRLYLLDGDQKAYERQQPHSAYQYEGYYWEDIHAESLWVWGNELWFGRADGTVCKFKPAGQTATYSDWGGEEDEAGEPVKQAVACHWRTPLMNLGTWGSLKTVSRVWVVGQPYARSSGTILFDTDREYERSVKNYTIDIFSWDDIDFNRFTFNTIGRPTITPTRRKAKKIKLFQVTVRNTVLHEPFGIFAIQIKFRIGGEIKR